MIPEEMDRKMEFIVDQQAQFAAHMDQLRDSQGTLTAAVVRIAEIVDERFRQTDERFRQTDERFKQTDERLRQTDDRLNNLINMFEKHVAGPDHGSKRAN